jgi:small-conductance mechanosensitive channel
MNGMPSVEDWRTVLTESFRQVGETLAGSAPKLVAAIVILTIGWAVSKLVEKISVRALRRFGVDRAAERLRISDALRQAGITTGTSGVLGRLLFWILILAFLLPALEVLELAAVATTVDRLIAYLPNVLAASLILLVGLLAGRFVQNVVESAAVVANLGQACHLATAASGLVVMIVVVLALEQLGIETRFLTLIAVTLAATLGLSMGLSLAFGARNVFTHIFAGHFLRQTLATGDAVEVRGQRGVVERVGPVDTLFRDGDRAWTIPNGALIDEQIGR